MGKILIVGGGWAGCAAAVSATKQGCSVTLLEKTDLLLGSGNVGGIMRNNGRFTAAEENIAMGADELFDITDKNSIHKNIDFPGHGHASFYDATAVEADVRKLLTEMGVDVKFQTRAIDVETEDGSPAKILIKGVTAIDGYRGNEEEIQEADAIVEATGSSGPMGNCMKYGNGCAMCIQRCPTFGPRVSLTEKAGLSDVNGLRESGKPGAFSGSCKLEKSSLSKKLQKKLEKDGFVAVPLPEQMINRNKLKEKVCQQYALDAFAENLILIDVGNVKLMTPFFNLELLRQLDGFENARFAEPYGGGRGNSVRYMSVGQCDEFMRAKGVENLFLAGEKAGFFVGHTEAISTGSLAGYNAAAYAKQNETVNQRELNLLKIPRTLAIGEMIAYGQEVFKEENGLFRRFTFAGGEFFQRMKERGLYRVDSKAVKKIVAQEGLLNIYNRGIAVVE